MNEEWIFHAHYIIHVPCKKKAFRFYGTNGRIWCNKCSARFPEELENLADFIYEKEEVHPLAFYFGGYNSCSFYIAPIKW